MMITQASIDFINNHITDQPPETGGILGSRDGMVITEIIMDSVHSEHSRYCRYEPDVSFFNTCIAEWQNKGISFMGLFHTHFANVKTLSEADQEYIIAIMNAMPDEIDNLFFPIFVLPKRELVCYWAKKQGERIFIHEEKVEII